MALYVPKTFPVPLRTFSTLDAFVQHQNNFLFHFIHPQYAKDMEFIGGYHLRPVVERFEQHFPERKQSTTNIITSIFTTNPHLDPRTPHEEDHARQRFINQVLFHNYKDMCTLVDPNDRGVIQDGRINENYLLN